MIVGAQGYTPNITLSDKKCDFFLPPSLVNCQTPAKRTINYDFVVNILSLQSFHGMSLLTITEQIDNLKRKQKLHIQKKTIG